MYVSPLIDCELLQSREGSTVLFIFASSLLLNTEPAPLEISEAFIESVNELNRKY